MNKFLIVLLFTATLFLTGCGSGKETQQEALKSVSCQSYEYANTWRAEGGRYASCMNIMAECSKNCDKAIDDYRDSNSENEAVNGCLDRCFSLYK